jgi:cytochrome c oxidase assembly factor CtaG
MTLLSIFSGIEVLFFVLGLLTTLSAVSLVYYHKQLKFKAGTWATLILGIFLLIFCIAWSCSSVLEGEPRAASMGLVVFGIPSILLLLFGRKAALKRIR